VNSYVEATEKPDPADEAGARVYAAGDEMFEVVHRIGDDTVRLWINDMPEPIEMPIEEAAWLGAHLTGAAGCAKPAG
jgi:hypothetical protein